MNRIILIVLSCLHLFAVAAPNSPSNVYKNAKELQKAMQGAVDIGNPNRKCSASNQTNTFVADYLIVGNGTAGGVLASFLSNSDPGVFVNSVLVLEAGQNRSADAVVAAGTFPPAFNVLWSDPKYAVTTLVADNQNYPLPLVFESFSAGRMWGGSSAHNDLFATRGSPTFWNNLATASGNPMFAYNTLLPFMKGFEAYHPFGGGPVNLAQRGVSGPLQITQFTPFDPVDPLSLAMSTVMGAPQVPDYNAGVTVCISPYQQTVTNTTPPLRSYAVTAFLPPTVVTPEGNGVGGRKLQILSGAQATKVLFLGTTAVGVEYIQDGILNRAFARKKVILSAGCPFSAQILQLSGVGDPAILTPLGIPVVINNPNVGDALKVHYGPVATIGPNDAGGIASPLPLMAFFDGQPFFTVNPGQRNFQIESIPGFIGSSAEVPLIVNPPTFSPIGPFTVQVVWIMEPRSTGSAFIIDNSPFSWPEINFNLYSDGDLSDPASDISASVAALKLIKEVADSLGCTMIFPTPANYAAGDAALAQAAKATTLSDTLSDPYHYCGTCSFGTVVDNNMNVIGAKNLMVVDNNVYPFPEDGNTAWAAYMTAVVAAQILGVAVPTA